jgi:hypothetical protein
MKIVTLQPSAVTDQITEDGTELQQLPYPFHVRQDGLLDGDFWRTQAVAAVGFQADSVVPRIDLLWRDAVSDPERAVGMYLVTRDAEGGWATWEIAIQAVTVTEVADDLFVIVGLGSVGGRWAKGSTVDAAKAAFRREGGQLSKGYTVYTFTHASSFEGVDMMGGVNWQGERPASREVKPWGKARG